MKKSIAQSAWDFVGVPFRLALFDQRWLPRFGWTSLEDERIHAVLPHVRGRLLDIGAGPNRLVREHGDGVGVDVHDWGGGVHVVENSADLPFADDSFDTVTCIAALNHIPNRGELVGEVKRLLRPSGRFIVTMINPILGGVGHAIWWYGEDRHRGGMVEGEVGGLWKGDIVELCAQHGLELEHHRRFVYGMNHLLVFR